MVKKGDIERRLEILEDKVEAKKGRTPMPLTKEEAQRRLYLLEQRWNNLRRGSGPQSQE